VRFTRHAKNKLRGYGLATVDAEQVVARPIRVIHEADGKPSHIGAIEGADYKVVLALDAADLIVTIYKVRR
jgi:hypothetical protein